MSKGRKVVKTKEKLPNGGKTKTKTVTKRNGVTKEKVKSKGTLGSLKYKSKSKGDYSKSKSVSTTNRKQARAAKESGSGAEMYKKGRRKVVKNLMGKGGNFSTTTKNKPSSKAGRTKSTITQKGISRKQLRRRVRKNLR